MRRLHIVGCPRSGTTLLARMIASCFENDGACEHEMSIFREPDSRAGLYISKQPNDIRQIRRIFHRDPALFIIYLGRDPRAVITSRHRAKPGQYFCNYRIWHECEVAARHYLGHPRFLNLRYEDLVHEPDRVQARISTHFPLLRQRHPFSNYHLHTRLTAASEDAMNGLRPANQDSLNKWRDHLPRVAQQYRSHPSLAQDLIRLGYESDEQWLTLLDDVPAITMPCRYPEQPNRLKEMEKEIRVYLKSRRYLRRLKN